MSPRVHQVYIPVKAERGQAVIVLGFWGFRVVLCDFALNRQLFGTSGTFLWVSTAIQVLEWFRVVGLVGGCGPFGGFSFRVFGI